MINRTLVLETWNSLREKVIGLNRDKKERKRIVSHFLNNSLSDLKDVAKEIREVINVMPNFSKSYAVITVREKVDSAINWVVRSSNSFDNDFSTEEIID
jgi:hypothetical protein